MGNNQRLWAPWRLAYIQGEAAERSAATLELLPGADGECFLCRCAVDPDPRRGFVVRRTEHWVALLNLYPYNNGHLLVAPRLHRARLDALTRQEQCDLTAGIADMVNLLEATIQPQGFNIGLNLGQVAGAGLPGHLHWHIVPRWNGDTNFMPAVAAVKVIPQALEALWELLVQQRAEA